MKTVKGFSVVLLIFGLGIIANVNYQSQTPQIQPPPGWWKPIVPPDKSFKVEMPGQVEHTHDPVTSDEPFVGEGYNSWEATTGLHFYSIEILCANELHRPKFTPDAYFAAVFGERRAGRQDIKQVSVDGFPGREVISTGSDGTSFIRWFVAGPRVYLLSLIAGGDKTSAVSAKRFFDSFHVSRVNASLPGCPGAEGRYPTATAGRIRLVVFPNYWMSNKKGEANTLLDTRVLEIRSRRTSLTEEWLFGALDYYDSDVATPRPEWYGRNFYGVRLNHDPVEISSLSSAEWKLAKVISTQATRVFWGDDKKPVLFEYRGHKYDKSSEHWGAVTVSPDGQWVAIYSYSGENRPVFLWSGGLPREGDVYWDVYDSTSGEKVLSWHAQAVSNPGLLGEGAIWIADRYFVMPFGSRIQACVIGILRPE